MTLLSLIVVLNLLLLLLENLLESSSMMIYTSPPHITLKQMDKLNKSIKKLKLISGAFVPITPTNGLSFSLLLNSNTTRFPIVQPKSLSLFPPLQVWPLCVFFIWENLIPALESHFSSLESTRKEALAAHESAQQIMIEQSSRKLFLWKVKEIRYSWKPPIYKYLTLLENSYPNAMDLLRLFRYYLP